MGVDCKQQNQIDHIYQTFAIIIFHNTDPTEKPVLSQQEKEITTAFKDIIPMSLLLTFSRHLPVGNLVKKMRTQPTFTCSKSTIETP